MIQMTASMLIEQLQAVPPELPVVIALSPGEPGPGMPCVMTDTLAFLEGELFPDFSDPGGENTPPEAVSVVALAPLQNMCHELRFYTLQIWAELVDKDKKAAVKYWDFCESLGHDEAREQHPARFKKSFELTNLTKAEACDYCDRTGAAMVGSAEEYVPTLQIRTLIGKPEWKRLDGSWPD